MGRNQLGGTAMTETQAWFLLAELLIVALAALRSLLRG
jgi:hypothetical protein